METVGDKRQRTDSITNNDFEEKEGRVDDQQRLCCIQSAPARPENQD
jgi:hypothetical protein